MKKQIAQALQNVLKNRKPFIISLYCGDERCIQGDLYAGLLEIEGLNIALEYPLGAREHADIAFFDNDLFENIQFIVELKHYSPHQTSPETSAVNEVLKEITKRFKNNIKELYLIQMLTHVEYADNQNVIDRYPFTNTYVKSISNISNIYKNKTLNLIYENIKNNIDKDLKYVSACYQIAPDIITRLHFYICGPFTRSILFVNNKLDMQQFPINSVTK
jgi:hypothetical protein